MQPSNLFKALSLSLVLGALGSAQTMAAAHKHKHHHHHTKTVHVTRIVKVRHPVVSESAQLAPEVQSIKRDDNAASERLDVNKNYFGGMFVTTSPYLGVDIGPIGQELMVNLPNVNEDLRLLQQRQKIDTGMRRSGKKITSPLMDFSGKFEAYVVGMKPYDGSTIHDIELATAELSSVIMFNDWMTGLMTISFDNTNTVGTTTILPRTSWARLFMDKGFFTVGNLNRFPGYASMGQLYVPFGSFSSFTPSGSIARWLGRTKAKTIVAGFAPCTGFGPFGSVYAFRSDSMVFASSYGINNYGANLMYVQGYNQWKAELGASYISTLTDASGMQTTGGSTFAGFGSSYVSEQIRWRIPGIDTRLKLNNDFLFASAEFVSAMRDFHTADMTYNSLGARPSAFHTELTVMFPVMDRLFGLTGAYGQTNQSLALNLPKRRYTMSLSTAPMESTYLSLEYRRDRDYSLANRASGAGSASFAGTGAARTSVLTQFGVNF